MTETFIGLRPCPLRLQAVTYAKHYATGEITLERAQKTVNSYMGLLSHCDSYQLKRAIFGEYSESEWVEGWFYLQRDSALIEAKKSEAGE